jgi:hypothetical protein
VCQRVKGEPSQEQGRGIADQLAHLCAGFYALNFSLKFFLFVNEQNPSEALRGVGSRTTFETPANWPRQPIGERRTAPSFPLRASSSRCRSVSTSIEQPTEAIMDDPSASEFLPLYPMLEPSIFMLIILETGP